MYRRGGNEQMDAGIGGTFYRVPGSVDVAGVCTGQRGHCAVADGFGDGVYRLEITGRRTGKAGFDHVYFHTLQTAGHLDLFLQVHAAAWGLLAVTQGCVEYLDPIHVHVLLYLDDKKTV